MRRQGSVYNGLLKIRNDCNIVTVHDAARPLVGRNYMVQLFLESPSRSLGEYTNIKITTPEDIQVTEGILSACGVQ